MILSYNPWALVQKTRHMFLSNLSYSSVKQKVREKARLSLGYLTTKSPPKAGP